MVHSLYTSNQKKKHFEKLESVIEAIGCWKLIGNNYVIYLLFFELLCFSSNLKAIVVLLFEGQPIVYFLIFFSTSNSLNAAITQFFIKCLFISCRHKNAIHRTVFLFQLFSIKFLNNKKLYEFDKNNKNSKSDFWKTKTKTKANNSNNIKELDCSWMTFIF